MQPDDTKNTNKKRDLEAGYTLSEILIVIVIISIVAAAVTPSLLSRFNSGQSRSAALQANTLAMAMDEYLVDVGRYPDPQEGVAALWIAPADATGWRGPYVRSPRTLQDPWGNAFVIIASTDPNRPPSVVSYGSDGVEGGEGPAADIRFE